jgi:hypothetical protein
MSAENGSASTDGGQRRRNPDLGHRGGPIYGGRHEVVAHTADGRRFLHSHWPLAPTRLSKSSRASPAGILRQSVFYQFFSARIGTWVRVLLP